MSGWRTIWIQRNAEGKLVPQTGSTGYAGADLPQPPDAVTWALGCPDGTMMLDADQYEKNGVQKTGADTLRDLADKLGPLPPTWKITSRGPGDRGGKLPYRIPPGVILRGAASPFVETIQRHHRWTWGPGTAHPRTGTPVVVYDQHGQPCELPPVELLPWLPAAWLEFLRADSYSGERVPVVIPDDGVTVCTMAAHWLSERDFAGAEPRGERANKAATYLKRKASEGHYVSAVIDQVRDALAATTDKDWDGMWAGIPVDPDKQDTDLTCCGREWGFGMTPDAPATSPAEAFAQVSELAQSVGTVGPQPSLLGGIRDGAWLDKQEFKPLKYHVDGLVPEGLTVLVGAPKIGKSWLVLGWALDLAAAGRTAIYFALEDSDRRMQWRCRLLRDGKPIPDNFRYVTVIPPGWITQAVAEAMASYGSDDEPPLVIVDTLGKVLPPTASGETPYQRDYRVTSALKAIADSRPGAAVLVNHHDRKADATDFVDAVSGTHGIAGAADTILLLTRPRNESAGLLMITGRDVSEGEYAMTHSQDRGRWTLDGGTLETAAAMARTRKAKAGLGDTSAGIVAFATERAALGVKAADVAAEFDMPRDEAGKYLRRLAESGRIWQPGRGLFAANGYPVVPSRRVKTPGEASEVSETKDAPGGAAQLSDTTDTNPGFSGNGETHRSDTSDTNPGVSSQPAVARYPGDPGYVAPQCHPVDRNNPDVQPAASPANPQPFLTPEQVQRLCGLGAPHRDGKPCGRPGCPNGTP